MRNHDVKIRIEIKECGVIVESDLWYWRRALNHVKFIADDDDIKINIKASDFINKLKYGYEDSQIKAWILNKKV